MIPVCKSNRFNDKVLISHIVWIQLGTSLTSLIKAQTPRKLPLKGLAVLAYCKFKNKIQNKQGFFAIQQWSIEHCVSCLKYYKIFLCNWNLANIHIFWSCLYIYYPGILEITVNVKVHIQILPLVMQ